MAELNYVNAGERIGAHTINGIIDALGGPNIPSDGGFFKTSTGALFQRRNIIGSDFNKTADSLFDVKWAEAPRKLSCEYKMLYIQLGRDFDFIKNRLEVDQIWAYDGDSEKGIDLSGSFEVNGPGRFYDGFVNTQLSALQEFPYPGLSVQTDPYKIGYGDGYLYGVYVKGNDEDNSTKKVFIITNEYESDNIKEFAQLSVNLTDVTISKITKLAVCTPSELTNGAKDHYMGSQLIKLPNEWSTDPDEDIKFRLRGKVETNDQGQYKWKIECYNGLFINDKTKDEDSGVRYNTHNFNDITPNKGINWTQISASENWEDSISKDINVYMNLTCTIEPATGSGEDFNGQYLITTTPASQMIHRTKEGTASLSATYVVGTVKFRNEIVDVHQNMLGDQTFIEMFNADTLNDALANLSSELFKVDSELSVLQLSSIERHEYKNEDGAVLGTALEIYQFHDIENGRDINDNDPKLTDFIVRTKSENGLPAEVQYLNLSSVLNQISGTCSCEISVDTDILNQTSSLQKLSNDDNEWYQLYNFNNTRADLDAKIWTIGDLDSSKSGKVGKLIDPSSKALLSVDILVRDNSTKQLKYMNLSVDSVKVDTYAANTKVKSIAYGTEIVFGQYTDQNYLTLGNFATRPNTKLSGLIKNNGLVDITDENTWVLTKKYDPRTQMMELTYDKLQLSVDLSAISSAISCDTDATPAQKSIEKNNGYIQLYDFDAPNITTKKTTLDNLSATYDLLDTNDAVLVRSGTELKYKRFQIETKLPGGGGQTSGYTGTQTQATTIKWNTDGQYKIELWGKDFQYENGLLKSVGAEKKIAALDTVGYSGS